MSARYLRVPEIGSCDFCLDGSRDEVGWIKPERPLTPVDVVPTLGPTSGVEGLFPHRPPKTFANRPSFNRLSTHINPTANFPSCNLHQPAQPISSMRTCAFNTAPRLLSACPVKPSWRQKYVAADRRSEAVHVRHTRRYERGREARTSSMTCG